MGVLRVWNGSDWDEIKGERGDTGASAYQIAVNEGFEGTEEEWLESLAVDPADIENAVDAAIDAEPRIGQLVTDVAAVTTTTDVLAALRFDPSHPNYGAILGTGLTAPQRTANTAAINLAASDAAAAGGTLVIKGDYEFAGSLEFKCHVDGSSGVLTYYGTPAATAVVVGSTVSSDEVFSRVMVLPDLINANKVGNGWAGMGTGYEMANLYSCHVTTQRTTGFATNMLVSAYGTGNVYNTYYMGWMENGKINLDLKPADAGGWVNENLFVGGRFSHNSSEGTNVTGVRHIRISPGAHPTNNNVFQKPSVEGNIAEYHVEISGPYNAFDHARWEASPPKVLLNGADTSGTLIFYGYNAHSIAFTFSGGASSNSLHYYARQNIWLPIQDKGVTFVNSTSAANAAITVMPTGSGMNTDRETGYAVRITSNDTRLKRGADANERVRIDHQNGEVFIGNGAVAPTAGIRSYGQTGMRFTGQFHGFYGATPVTQPAANPDTSGATLAQLETEVNQLKAALRSLGLIAT